MSTTLPPSGPRRRLVPPVFLVLLLLPLVEIWTMVQVGGVIGGGWTVVALLATGVLGLWLVRREGLRAWRSLGGAVAEGRMPHREIADGVLVLGGGLLLLVPGFLTDVLGLFLLLPFLRPLTRRLVAGVVARRLTAAYDATGTVRPPGAPGGPRGPAGAHGPDHGGDTPPGPFDGPPPQRRGEGEVVRGEVVDP